MQWFKIKEKSAGKKRLAITWFIYKNFGKSYVKMIAFFVSIFTILFNKDLRKYSAKYFDILYNYTNNKALKPTFYNTFKHCLNYSYSLVDKIGVFGNKFNHKDIEFENIGEKKELFNSLRKSGVFFICNHIGNIEVLRSLFSCKEYNISSVSIFLQKNHCKIFNDFISSINAKNEKIKIYPIEEIDVSNSIEIEEKLESGGAVFMAGDRIAASNKDKVIKTSFLNTYINLPEGVFKFAKIFESDIYYISCIKQNNKYIVYLKKATDKKEDCLQKEFILFMEKMVRIAPFQFYHFCDYFLSDTRKPDK